MSDNKGSPRKASTVVRNKDHTFTEICDLCEQCLFLCQCTPEAIDEFDDTRKSSIATVERSVRELEARASIVRGETMTQDPNDRTPQVEAVSDEEPVVLCPKCDHSLVCVDWYVMCSDTSCAYLMDIEKHINSIRSTDPDGDSVTDVEQVSNSNQIIELTIQAKQILESNLPSSVADYADYKLDPLSLDIAYWAHEKLRSQPSPKVKGEQSNEV